MRTVAHILFPRMKITYEEQPGDHPAVFVCNHAAMCGPVVMTLYFDRPHQTWTIHSALDRTLSYRYAYHDVFFGESRRFKWFWRLLARIVGRALPRLLEESGTIPVFHDRRVLKTLRASVAALKNGEDIVIFAESPQRFSEFVNELQPGFVDLGRFYAKETGEHLNFYPVYLEKKHCSISIGRPISYDPASSPDDQRVRISTYLRNVIDCMGRTVPKHDPVPFLPPRWYDAYGEYESEFPKYWEMIEGESNARQEKRYFRPSH